jgi:predicted NAD/FAD-dependent oxidoreductase
MITEITASRVEVQSTRDVPRVWEVLHWAGNHAPNHTVLTAINLPENHDLVVRDIDLIGANFRAIIPSVLMDSEGRLVVWLPVTREPTHWNFVEAAMYALLWDTAEHQKIGGRVVTRPAPTECIYKALVAMCNGAAQHSVYEVVDPDMAHLQQVFSHYLYAWRANKALNGGMRR